MTKRERDELKGEIRQELSHIKSLLKEIGGNDDLSEAKRNRLQGSVLHDFYNACERIFRKIAVELNGGIETTIDWHRTLLYKMTLSIKGVRRKVITDETASFLDEYLGFRHVFRNIYGFELKGDRTDRLSQKLPVIIKIFSAEIEKFIESIK